MATTNTSSGETLPLAAKDQDPLRRILLIAVGLGLGMQYFVINEFSAGRQPFDLHLAFESQIPLSPSWVFVYYAYFFYFLLPILYLRSVSLLGRFIVAVAFVQLIAFACFLILPARMDRPNGFALDSFSTWGLALVYYLDKPHNLCPSLHLANAVLVSLTAYHLNRAVGRPFVIGTTLIAVSTLFTKQHYLADVATGIALGYAGYRVFAKLNGPYEGIDKAHQLFDDRYLLAIPALYFASLGVFYVLYLRGVELFPWPL